MLQGASTGSFKLGSLISIREARLGGFSMAEMLVVMLIMSFIAIGVPAIHFKKTELKTKRSLHGRYECYYDGETLKEYYINEEGAATGPNEVEECTFSPPRNAVYFLIHAVGGGGGASDVSGSISVNPKTENSTFRSPNDFPEWLREVQGLGKLPDVTSVPPEYNATRSGSHATVTYGKSGSAGKSVSIFFPRLTGFEIIMKPGKGGAIGDDGEETLVQFKKLNDPDEKVIDVIKAEGGTKGSGSETYPLWLDGDGAMCPIKELVDRKFNQADFATNIEMDEDTEMDTQLTAESVLAGSGGAGAYGIYTGTANVTYTVNGDNVSDYVRKPTCDEPKLCDNDAAPSGGSCPAQAGRNGAVVILW